MAGRWVRLSVARWLRGLVISVVAVAAVSGLIALLEPHLPVLSLLVLYILAVPVVAVGWGTMLAVVTSVLSAVCFAYLFHQSARSGWATGASWSPWGVFVITAVVVGELAACSRRQAEQSARLVEEQSALRQAATLVAQAGPPSAVFEAVTREVGQLCDAELARMARYEADGTVTGWPPGGGSRSSWPWAHASAWTG